MGPFCISRTAFFPPPLHHKKHIMFKPLHYPACLLLALGMAGSACQKMNDVVKGEKKPETMASANAASTAADFTIAVIGDTQNYVDYSNDPDDADCQGMTGFTNIISWITANKTAQNIVYAVTLGDITDQFGSTSTGTEDQWVRARDTYTPLKTAGIPFGVVPGNHDMKLAARGNYPNDGTTFPVNAFFNQYFPRSWFPSYNKEGFPDNLYNENHFDVVNTPAGEFLVLYLRWHHMESEADVAINWAYDVMSRPENASRKVIVATHYTVSRRDTDPVDGKYDWGMMLYQTPGYSQAQKVYNKLKQFPNFFLFLGGHAVGEFARQDTYAGYTVKSFTCDYSNSCGTGSTSYPEGVIRTMRFSPANDLIEIKAFVPGQAALNTFTVPWNHAWTASRTNDYDNNGASQPAFFNNGAWTIPGMSGFTYGITGDVPIPADYDGDGDTDAAIFREGGLWRRKSFTPDIQLGSLPEDIPVPGDYDGNGTADPAIYRPSSSTFYVQQAYLSSNISAACGSSGDIPVPMDYNGDGKVDYATFNPTSAVWTIPGISNSQYGVNGDIPVPGDYNGEGRNTRAVYRRSNHTWYVYGVATDVVIGQNGDIPVPGDYDGDGKTDIAVYRPSTGQVIINGQATINTGVLNAKPVNLPYAVRKFFF